MTWVEIYGISNWLHTQQVLIGCAIIGFSSIATAFASILKSRADRAANSRKSDEKAKSKRLYIQFIAAVIICGGWTLLGTYLTKSAADESALHAARIQQEAAERNAAMQRKFDEKIQLVLAKLNAAKAEDSERITEEKIHAIKSDFTDWASGFAENLNDNKNKWAKLRETQQKQAKEQAGKELERQRTDTLTLYPLYSFAIKTVEECIKAYAEKLGDTNVIVNAMQLPDNFYTSRLNSIIHIKTAQWRISIINNGRADAPFREGYDFGRPTLIFRFNDNDTLGFRMRTDNQEFQIFFRTSLPAPTPESVQGEFSMADYEGTIKSTIQKVMTPELLQLQ